MEAKRIKGNVYRVKFPTGGLLVEVPEGSDDICELAKFCANLSMSGYIITSVTRVFDSDGATPKVSVLSTKEYKNEIKRLTKEKKGGCHE